MNLPASLWESPIVYRLGWTLLHSLWQGLAVALLLWVALAILRKRSATLRYGVGCMAMLAMAGLSAATFLRTQPPVAAPVAVNPSQQSRSVAAPRVIAVDRTEDVPAGGIVHSHIDRSHISERSSPITAPIVSAQPARLSFSSVEHRAFDLLTRAAPWLVLAWLVGVLLMSIWNLGAWIAVQQLKTMTTKPVSNAIEELATKLSNRLGLERRVRLLASAVIDSPLVIGMFRPAILLPVSVLTDLPIAHLEALLAHELAHVRRHDYFVNLLQSVIETLLFYHPAVWWISARIRSERENCCDDLAVAVTRDRATYVRALASVAGAKVPSLAPAASGGELLPRLKRLLGKPDADSARSSRWLAGCAVSILCVVGVVTTVVRSQTSPPSPTTKPAAVSTTQPAAAARELRINVVHALTGEPVAGVRGSFTLDRKESKAFDYDNRGEYRIPLHPETRSLYFFYHKEGFVESMVSFGEGRNPEPIPATYTIHLQPGLSVGGVVHDDLGNVVEGVNVSLDFRAPFGAVLGYGSAKTDANGRWTFNGAPDHPASFSIYTAHRDFIMDSFHHDISGTQFQALRDKVIVSSIRRGVSVAGSIHDNQGKPVADAQVTPDLFGVRSATQSDAQGNFVLRGVEPGQKQIKVIAEGFAPQVTNVVATADVKPLDIHLEKGRLFRGRVVDREGKPVQEASITLAKWRDVYLGVFSAYTDADGRFRLENAPTDTFSLSVGKIGLLGREVSLVANTEGREVVVRLDPLIIVRGTVVDDKTGAPLDKFIAHLVAEHTKQKIFAGDDAPGVDGKFEIRLTEPADLYSVRVRADGYLPVHSPKVTGDNGQIEFNLRMRKGNPITGIILQQDGKPAVASDVELHEVMAVQADNGILRPNMSKEVVVVKTDSAGRFTLPPREGQISVVVIHETGWLEFKQAAALPEQTYTLHAWARVEGQIFKGDQPLVGEKIVLHPVVFRDPVTKEVSSINFFEYRANTDAQGHFVFDRVVSGKSELYVEHRLPTNVQVISEARGSRLTLDLQPGDRKVVRIGGTGRPVTGQLTIPQDLKEKNLSPRFGELRLVEPAYIQPADFDSLSAAQRKERHEQFEQSEIYRKYASRPNAFAVIVQPNGSFRADDVPAGDYILSINVQTPTPGDTSSYRIIASADLDVHVPEMPGDKSSTALDLGTIPINLYHFLDAGAMAPSFEADTYDGGKLKLADLRGKYVLLDFWATWCAPCVAGFKDLETLHRQWAGDSRFVMLGVSIDEHIAEPTKFLQSRKLPWLQAFAGDLEESSAHRAFGVRGIPSLWLIGPDGKIIAKDIDPDKVEKIVKDALAGH